MCLANVRRGLEGFRAHRSALSKSAKTTIEVVPKASNVLFGDFRTGPAFSSIVSSTPETTTERTIRLDYKCLSATSLLHRVILYPRTVASSHGRLGLPLWFGCRCSTCDDRKRKCPKKNAKSDPQECRRTSSADGSTIQQRHLRKF